MNQTVAKRTGGQVLIDALVMHGVERAFCVPGESFLPALDALHNARAAIELVVCRQEGGAAHMAEAYAKLTGKPGICLVTRGPGATNASIAVHTAAQDSTPLILLVGQVSTRVTDRDAWQEADFRQMFGSMAKWVVQVERAERLPEIISRAFHLATAGRAGPVVVALPEDVLYAQLSVADAGSYHAVRAHPGAADLRRLQAMLAAAKRPLAIVGGSGWDAAACAALQAFAERFDLPVGSAFRRQDLFDNRHPNYAGNVGIAVSPKLAARVREADLILAIGTRLCGTTTSDHTLLEAPCPRQTLVHVHAGAEELGRVYQAALPINANMPEFAAAARELAPPAHIAWRDWTRAARADYESSLVHEAMPGPVDLGEIMAYLRRRLPADAIVANGAGNYAAWVHRFYAYTGLRTQLAPTSGVMGYGVPAACAAALAHPQRTVVCFAGDGCFLMNSQELATARQYRLKIVFVVVNNGMYGSIRMHQEMHYPGNVYGTMLENPDFAALAVAYGLKGEIVTRTADFAAAFERAMAADTSTLLELRIDPEAITPRTTLAALREQALQRQAAQA